MKSFISQLVRGFQLENPISDYKKGTPMKEHKKGPLNSSDLGPQKVPGTPKVPKFWTTRRNPKRDPDK